MNLTSNEKEMLVSIKDTDYCDGELTDTPWTGAQIEASGLSSKVARGVISSLIKKGLVWQDDYEGMGRLRDSFSGLTEEGLKVAASLLEELKSSGKK